MAPSTDYATWNQPPHRESYTNHRLDLDFNAKARSCRVEEQVIQLLNFAFLPTWGLCVKISLI